MATPRSIRSGRFLLEVNANRYSYLAFVHIRVYLCIPEMMRRRDDNLGKSGD